MEVYARNLWKGLHSRLGRIDRDELHVLATFLDLRDELLWRRAWKSPAKKTVEVCQLLLTRFDAIRIRSRATTSQVQSFSFPDILSLLDDPADVDDVHLNTINCDLTAEAELHLYPNDMQNFQNMLNFFKQPVSQTRFKWCTVLARQVFCATAITAGYNRSYSTSGIYLCDKRQGTSDCTFDCSHSCSAING